MIVSRSVFAESLPYRQRLVDTLVAEGACSSHLLREAFLAVPREAFLSGFYMKKQGDGFSWTWMPAPSGEGSDQEARRAWYETIYQDSALTTQIDANGRPTSSSSQPSVMAMMLEALSVVPKESRVLEIGTGTGYNAALLAALVGVNHLVTTMEIDALVAKQAQQQLHQIMGPGIDVIVGDGLQLSCDEAGYDRIIVTGSFPTIPRSWVRALAPGGILVMDLRGDLAGGLIRMQKGKEGSVLGTFIPQGNAIFMPLRPRNELQARASIETNGPVVESEQVADEVFSPGAMLSHADAALWIQCAFPHLRVRRQYPIGSESPIIYLIDPERKTTAVMTPSDDRTHITVYGTYPLWTHLRVAYQRWEAAGHPTREGCQIQLDQGGTILLSA